MAVRDDPRWGWPIRGSSGYVCFRPPPKMGNLSGQWTGQCRHRKTRQPVGRGGIVICSGGFTASDRGPRTGTDRTQPRGRSGSGCQAEQGRNHVTGPRGRVRFPVRDSRRPGRGHARLGCVANATAIRGQLTSEREVCARSGQGHGHAGSSAFVAMDPSLDLDRLTMAGSRKFPGAGIF